VDLQKFRAQLVAAFPPQPFNGPIATHDGCDECNELRLELRGKSWDQVPDEFIDFNSAAPCLLDPDALVTFLPAWLLRSMETLGTKSVLAEFTLYFLCPGSDDEEGWDETRIAAIVELFRIRLALVAFSVKKHQCGKRGLARIFAAFAKFRACTLFARPLNAHRGWTHPLWNPDRNGGDLDPQTNTPTPSDLHSPLRP
jgi:hypothetical protein